MNSKRCDKYNFLLKEYREKSLCLNEEQFKKEKLFVFVYNYYFSGILVKRMCHDPRQFCHSKFFCRHPFKLKDGYIVGSIFDRKRFCSTVKQIEQFIDKYINDDSNVECQVIAKISKEELEVVKNKFKITKLF